MEKLVKDGKVAVLIAVPYGAGWSTWNDNDLEMLFDPTIVDLVLSKPDEDSPDFDAYMLKFKNIFQLKYPEIYSDAIEHDLRVEWVPVGTRFRVEDHDGAEYIVFEEDMFWITA